MHLRASRLCPLSRRQSLSAHHRHPPPQPARGRLGLRSVSLARRRRALRRRGAQALPAAPLHRRSRARSQPSRLRLLRDEDVPRALLQGLHRRALRRGGRRRRELSLRRAARAGWSFCAPSATRPRPISNSNPPPRSTHRCSASSRVRALAAELVRPLSHLRAVILQASGQSRRSRRLPL